MSVIRDPKILHYPNWDPDISIADAQERRIPICASGDLQLKFPDTPTIHTQAVASKVPRFNILSLHELEKNGITVDFGKSLVLTKKGRVIAPLAKSGPYYWISSKYIRVPKTNINVMHVQSQSLFPLDFIHRLLGHINIQVLRESIKQGTLTSISMSDIDWTGYSKFQCEDCISGKANKHKHVKGSRVRYQKSYKPFEYLHTDIFGPVPHMPRSSPSYFLAFTDEATRFRWVYPLWSKDAETVTEIFRSLVNMIRTQFDGKVLSFQMDQGSEYTNHVIRKFFKEQGIIPCYTSVGDSKANGIAERLNYLLLNDCRTLLKSSGLSLHLWFYAVQFSTLMRNSVITSSIGTSSRAKAGLAGLDVSTILPFGQRVMVNRTPINKLQPRGILGFALTPSTESHGYLIYIPSKHIVTDTSNYLVIHGKPNKTEDADTIIDPLFEQLESRQTDFADPNPSSHSGGIAMDRSIHPDESLSEVSPTLHTDALDESNDSGGTDTRSLEIIEDSPTLNDPDSISLSQNEPPINPQNTSNLGTDSIDHYNDPIDQDEHTSLDYNQSVLDDAEVQARRLSSPRSHDAFQPQGNIAFAELQDHQIDPITAIASSVGINDEPLNSEPSSEDLPSTASDTQQSITAKSVHDDNTGPEHETDPLQSISNVGGSDKNETSYEKDLESRKNKIFRLKLGEIPSIMKPRTKRKITDTLQEIEDRTVNKKPKRQVLYVNVVHSNPAPQIRPSLSYHEAIVNNQNNNDAEDYKEAYMKEYKQLIKMKTWNPNKPIDGKLIPKQQLVNSMFIFTTKRDGSKKCRLVARGDQQKVGTYKEDLKANTVHHYALMTSLNIALDRKMFITQLDISSAYLYADLEEDLYIRAPPHMKAKGKAFKLNKSLYGLKQSGANWYQKIGNYLNTQCHMKELTGWPCVFKADDGTFACLFVDDIIVMSKDLKTANKLIDILKKEFETKIVQNGKLDDNYVAKYDILGLEIEYIFGKKMTIGMEKSLTEKLPHLNFEIDENYKRYLVPGTPKEHIHKNNFVLEEVEYKDNVKRMQKAIGLLSYVGYKYRFDILYYVNILAQHTLYPSKQVQRLTQQLINFVWHSRQKNLVWYATKKNKTNRITAITDASFANEDGFRSQLGHYYCLNGKVIGGRSSSEKLRVISSTEAEIYAVSESIPMLQGLSHLIRQLDSVPVSLKILTDSKPTISIVEDQGEDSKAFRNRFFGTRAFRLRDEVQKHGLRLKYIKTEENYADILTKPTSIAIYKKLTQSWMK